MHINTGIKVMNAELICLAAALSSTFEYTKSVEKSMICVNNKENLLKLEDAINAGNEERVKDLIAIAKHYSEMQSETEENPFVQAMKDRQPFNFGKDFKGGTLTFSVVFKEDFAWIEIDCDIQTALVEFASEIWNEYFKLLSQIINFASNIVPIQKFYEAEKKFKAALAQ